MRHGWILLAMVTACGGTEGGLPFAAAGGGGGAAVSGSGGAGGGSASGGGGAQACAAAADCTGYHDVQCSAWECSGGVCALDAFPFQELTDTVIGDCKEYVCDGHGHTVVQPRDSDFSDDGNPCTVDACNNGTPTHDPAPLDAFCIDSSNADARHCDGAGHCVVCNHNSQCAQCQICSEGACFDVSCATPPSP